jgi:NAD(P)-dependent dehydrogenase (short-subunit alcohol dehydrogenase family)
MPSQRPDPRPRATATPGIRCARLCRHQRVVQAKIEAFSKVHIVRNKAGANGAGAADNISPQDWSWVIDINLTGVVHGVKAFVPLLKRHGEGGCIVNTAYLSQRRKPAAKAFACLLVANPA